MCHYQVHDHNHDHHGYLPCLHCQPGSFIRVVQHLIERCLVLHMSREQCVKSLALHASIPPIVTLTGTYLYATYIDDGIRAIKWVG
ncbi:hypothetical protein LINPERPRIM_LOCUS28235 [Linum perenne]